MINKHYMEELIKIKDYTTQQLPYYVKFTAEFIVEKPCMYKEDVHANLYRVVGRMPPELVSQYYILKAFDKEESGDNEKLVFSLITPPDLNYQLGLRVAVIENNLRIEYFELRNENLLLPNIGNFLVLMTIMGETIGMLSNNFANCKMDVLIASDSNANVAFYRNYCPLIVEFIPTLTYKAVGNLKLPVHIENNDTMFSIMRRFFQLFKSEKPCSIPYISLNKGQFDEGYAKFWKS